MRAKYLYIKFISVIVMTFCIFQLATAAPIVWKLSNVTFDDGGSATGFIQLDLELPDLLTGGQGLIIDFNIAVSGGDEDIFPSVAYTPDSTNEAVFLPFGSGQPGDIPQLAFLFRLDGQSPFGVGRTRSLAMTPGFPLDGSRQRVPLLISNLLASECYTCGPFRRINSGGALEIPLPSTHWLFILGFIGILYTQYRHNKSIH